MSVLIGAFPYGTCLNSYVILNYLDFLAKDLDDPLFWRMDEIPLIQRTESEPEASFC